MTNRRVTTNGIALVAGCLCFVPAGAEAQVSKVRNNDGAVLSMTAPRASTVVPDAHPAVVEALPDGITLIYSNFGTGSTLYNAGTGWTEAGAEANDYPLAEAMSFTPNHNYALLLLEVAVTYLQGTNGMTLVLAEDNNGLPGNIIYSTTFTNLPAFGTCCMVEAAKLTPTRSNFVALKSGQRYWLYPLPADTTTYLIWNLDITNKQGNGAVSEDYGVTWNTATLNPFGAFRLYGTRY